MSLIEIRLITIKNPRKTMKRGARGFPAIDDVYQTLDYEEPWDPRAPAADLDRTVMTLSDGAVCGKLLHAACPTDPCNVPDQVAWQFHLIPPARKKCSIAIASDRGRTLTGSVDTCGIEVNQNLILNRKEASPWVNASAA